MRRFALVGSASGPGFGPNLRGTASALEGIVDLEGTASAIGTASWFPVAGTVQNVRMSISASGNEVAVGISSYAGNSADGAPEWTGDWPLTGGRWPIVNPLLHAGAAACLRPIAVRGEYRDRAGALLFDVPLISNGQAFGSGSRRSLDGAFANLSGGVRDDRGEEPVSYSLLPHSGRQRFEILEELATAAGIASSATSSGVINHPIEISSSAIWSTAEQLARLGGQKLYWREDGRLGSFPLRISAGEPIAMVITDANLAASASIEVTYPTQPVTTIFASGTEMQPDTSGAIETDTVTRRIYAFRRRVLATHRLESTGVITDLGTDLGDEIEILDQEVETRTTRRGGTVIGVYEIVRGWKLMETWRHVIDDAGSPTPGDPFIVAYNTGAYFYGAPSVDGSEPCYLYDTERWVTISETWTEHLFNEDGWQVGTRVYSKGWRFPEWAWKTSATSVTNWDEQPVRPSLHVTGPGKGVEPDGREIYSPGFVGPPFDLLPLSSSLLAYEETVFDVADGYILSKSTLSQGWRRTLGSLAWYQDGTVSAFGEEQFGNLAKTDEVYTETGEASHVRQTFNYDFSRLILGEPANPSRTVEDQAGYLPAATRLAEFEPAAAAKTLPLEGEFFSPSLLECWPERQTRQTYELAENIDELEFMARLDLEEAAAVYVRFSLPAMFSLRVGQVAMLFLRAEGIARRARIWEMRHNDTRAGILSDVVARFSLIGDAL